MYVSYIFEFINLIRFTNQKYYNNGDFYKKVYLQVNLTEIRILTPKWETVRRIMELTAAADKNDAANNYAFVIINKTCTNYVMYV